MVNDLKLALLFDSNKRCNRWSLGSETFGESETF